MKYLKKFQSINKSHDEIATICRKYNIENWILNSDLSIDVKGDVNLDNMKLIKLQIRFRNVSGNFSCHCSELSSLDGCPLSVGGHFRCSYNNLTSLEGCPLSVGGDFICSWSKLINLKGSPLSVGGNFYCTGNSLISLEGGPNIVGGNFDCSSNNLTSLEGCPTNVGGYFSCIGSQIRDFEGIGIIGGDFYCDYNPIFEIWKLFVDTSKIELLNDYDAIRGEEIILDRLNDFLQVIGENPATEVKGYKCI